MRGRELFIIFKPIIGLLETTFRLVPYSIKDGLWVFTESWRGKAGLLIRYLIARTCAASCGNVVYIGPYVEIRNWRNLHIGSNVSIHRFCYIDATGHVYIGDNVSIAHATSILTTNHTWRDPKIPIRDNPMEIQPVYISNDVWIGCGCRILAGVRVGPRSVIAAGSVVVRDVQSGTLAGGVPARVLKSIKDDQDEGPVCS